MSDYITERWRAHMYMRGTLDPTDADKQRALSTLRESAPGHG